MRNLLRDVDYLPTMYFVGLWSMMSDSLGRRIGDRLAGTIVVRQKERDIVVWPIVVLILSYVSFSPIVLSQLLGLQERPKHARIEVDVLSSLPIFIEDDDEGFSVVLQIKNVGDAEAERCIVDFLACPEYVLLPSDEDLFVGDIRPGQSIKTALELRLRSKPDTEFVVVIQVISEEKASRGINIPVSLRSD